MTPIYVVTSGEYSDYGIRAVFDNQEMADAMVAEANKGAPERVDTYRVELFTLNPGAANYHEGRALWTVAMRKDGTVVGDLGGAAFWATDEDVQPARWMYESTYIQGEPQGMPFRLKRPRLPMYRVTGFFVTETVWARDREHAVKICNERRAQHIALGRWDVEEAKIRKMFSEPGYYADYYRMEV